MNNRIVGLDLLRSIIMIFGPTLHASMIMGGAFGFNGYFNQSSINYAIFNYSHQFRMELFFIISGFFSSLVISRKGTDHYIESRKKRIFRPTILSLITILPITCMLMFYIKGDTDIKSYLSYRHLWFLVTLSMISLITFVNPRFFLNTSNRIARYLNGRPYIFSMAVFFILFFVSHILFIISKKILPRDLNVSLQISESILYMAPYIVGMTLYFISSALSKKTITCFLFLFTVWYVVSLTPFYDAAPGVIKVMLKDISTVMVCLSIFYLFFSMKIQQNKFISELSRIALPFYLFHLPVLILLSSIYYEITKNDSDIQYTLIVIPLTILITYFISWSSMRNIVVRKSMGMA